MDKEKLLFELARKRQNTRYPEYNCISDYHNGIYECDYVSPYSKSAHNYNSDILIFLQDWSSDEKLSKDIDQDSVRYGYSRRFPTNINLSKLLLKYFDLTFKDVYITNLFPFIKKGSMTDKIYSKVMVRATKEFGYPQVEIIKPKLVICLGILTFNSFRTHFGLKKLKLIEDAVNSNFQKNGIEYFCQSHPGFWGKTKRNENDIDRVSKDWERMSQFYKAL